MAVRIRLSRGGSKKRPFYRIVAADSRAPRDGKYIERLGSYNPLLPQDHAERLIVKEDRVKHWLSVGALPTDRLEKILSSLGLVAAPKAKEQTKKPLPKAKAQERVKEKEEKALAAAEAAKQAEEEAKAAAEAPAPVAEEVVEAAPAEEAPVEEAPVAEEANAE